nr:5'-nucleotidase [Lentzea indica]
MTQAMTPVVVACVYDLGHMGPSLEKLLVVGIASSALFDLAESDAVFQSDGEQAYRAYQEAHLDEPFATGVAFPFIKRLLRLNDIGPLVEVIVLSRNSPDTGLRILRSAAHHGLTISRAIFTQGRAPHEYMPALNMSLFLSANEDDVRKATAAGLPAGRCSSRPTRTMTTPRCGSRSTSTGCWPTTRPSGSTRPAASTSSSSTRPRTS